VHWDLRESMTEADLEIILQAAKEKCPQAKPQIISDNVLNASGILKKDAAPPGTAGECGRASMSVFPIAESR